MERFASGIIRYKWLIVLAVAGITLYLGSRIRHLSIDSDIISSLNDHDMTARLYQQIGTDFGGNEIGMIVLETENVFTREVIGHVKEITDSLRFTQGVSMVTSLTNILDIKSSDWGIEVGKLVDEYNLPTEPSELDSLKNYVLSKEMYRGVILSEDATATVILFHLAHDAEKQEIANMIRDKINGMNLPVSIYYGGLPFLLNDITDLIASDMGRLFPVAFLIIALFLFLSFRSLKGFVLPIITAGLSVVWTIGLMSVSGYQLTMISSNLPVVLLAVGSAYTIHVVNSFKFHSLAYSEQALMKALAYIIVPVFLAAVTTMAGFLSFVFGSYLSMVREFGIFTATGTFFALLLSIFFIPALISIFTKKGKKSGTEILQEKRTPSHSMLKPLMSMVLRHPKKVIMIWGILLLVSIGGIFMVKTNVNITSYFKKDNSTRITENLLQKKFGGSMPVYVLFEGDMQSPEVLKMMIETANFMKEDPNIVVAQSVADLVKQMNDAMGEGMAIPDEKAKIEQLWFLLEGQEIMSQLVSGELDEGVIQSKFASIETDDIQDFTLNMQHYVKENSDEGLAISFTGIPPIYHKLNKSLVRSQYSSLIIAVLLVLVMVGMILRSFLNGVYATVPIITTILILLGFMGFTGIPLDIATVLVGSVALGIGIDYSIHIISGFNRHMNENEDVAKALENAVMKSGKAVITNAVSVAAGFLVLMFSQLVPMQHFGLLIAISMIGSAVGALTLLPALLITAGRRSDKVTR